MKTAIKRRGVKRRIRVSAVGAAADVIGPLQDGDDVCGLTNGQFSLIDIIEHVLGQAGPARLTISTWTMGIYDLDVAARFCADGRIRGCKWIVDPSFFSRRVELSGRLIEAFGVESFRAVNTHAKWVTVRGDDLAVVVRSSMNLNPNKRLENFDLSVDDGLCAFFEGFVDDVFASQRADGDMSQSLSKFQDILDKYEQIKQVSPTSLSKGWGRGWAMRAG